MDEAEQQQTSQALLVLYAIERSHPEPMPLEEIDCQCEALIARLAMGAINFDVREAVEFLWKMGFVESVGDSWILAGKIRQAI